MKTVASFILAEAWKVTPDLVQAVELHHEIGEPESGGPLVALVHLSDLPCRLRDLVTAMTKPGKWILRTSRGGYAKEVGELVSTVFACGRTTQHLS